MRHLNKLSREAVVASSLEAFKAKLNGILGRLVLWLATLQQQGG